VGFLQDRDALGLGRGRHFTEQADLPPVTDSPAAGQAITAVPEEHPITPRAVPDRPGEDEEALLGPRQVPNAKSTQVAEDQIRRADRVPEPESQDGREGPDSPRRRR